MNPIEIGITVAGAFVAAAAGALAAFWHQRSRPWLGLKSIRRDDRDLVEIPDELRGLAKESAWAYADFALHAPLYQLVDFQSTIERVVRSCKGTLDLVTELGARLDKGVASLSEQRRFIEEFLSDYFVPQILSSMTLAGRLPLPDDLNLEENAPQVVQVDDLTSADQPEKALIVYGEGRRHSIKAGAGLVGPESIRRTRLLGRVLQYFAIPEMASIMAAMKVELQRDYQILLEMRERLTGLIRSRRLVLRAQVANTGGSPVHLEPYALLKIRSSGKAVGPVVASVQGYRLFEPGMEEVERMVGLVEGLASKQGVETGKTPKAFQEGPEFVVVNGGQLVEVELATVTPIDDDAVVQALEAGMLSCQLIMKRATGRTRKWLVSKELVMGLSLSEEKRTELLSYG